MSIQIKTISHIYCSSNILNTKRSKCLSEKEQGERSIEIQFTKFNHMWGLTALASFIGL